MINPDRATLDFLNSFSPESQQKGEEWHREGCVTQIFGNYLLIRGRVESPEGENIETTLTIKGNGWIVRIQPLTLIYRSMIMDSHVQCYEHLCS